MQIKAIALIDLHVILTMGVSAIAIKINQAVQVQVILHQIRTTMQEEEVADLTVAVQPQVQDHQEAEINSTKSFIEDFYFGAF